MPDRRRLCPPLCLVAAWLLSAPPVAESTEGQVGQCRDDDTSANDCCATTLADCYCAAGHYTAEAGWASPSASCGSSTPWGFSCTACAAGRYRAEVAYATSCNICGSGQYSSAGSPSCSSCAGGQHSGSGSSGCSTCTTGLYSAPGSSSCSSCEAGQYQGAAGQISCISCSAGSVTDTLASAAASTCTACVAGQYSSDSIVSCAACNAGKYQDDTGAPSAQARSQGDLDLTGVTVSTRIVQLRLLWPWDSPHCVPDCLCGVWLRTIQLDVDHPMPGAICSFWQSNQSVDITGFGGAVRHVRRARWRVSVTQCAQTVPRATFLRLASLFAWRVCQASPALRQRHRAQHVTWVSTVLVGTPYA
jgi:hypothetical protein